MVGVGSTMIIFGIVVFDVTIRVAVEEHPLIGLVTFNEYVPDEAILRVTVVIPPGLHE
jgi:hypothetical protein